MKLRKAVLAAALVVPLAGCAGNVGPVSESTSSGPGSSAAGPPTTTPPFADAGGTPPATGPAGTPVAPAGRPTPLSATALPTLSRPAGPPKKPTDNRPTDLIAGRITRGGTGPCYGLVDENEREYALYGPDAGELREGAFVTLRTAPPTTPVDCGPGIPMRIVTG